MDMCDEFEPLTYMFLLGGVSIVFDLISIVFDSISLSSPCFC